MAVVLATMPSTLAHQWPRDADTVASMEPTFQRDFDEEDDEFSDDSDMTDDSSQRPSIASPTSSTTGVKVVSSPSSVSDVASATDSAWPTRPVRRKRTRMSQEERKVRHREVQRQFMKRKRARIAELRKVQAGVEKQLSLLAAYHEAAQLQQENEVLEKHFATCEMPSSRDLVPPHMNFGNLVFSVPTEEPVTEFLITEHEWSEIFDVLSDESHFSSLC